jgi:hypothetical protein
VTGCGDFEGDRPVGNRDVSVPHNATVDLKHAQGSRIDLGVTEP